MEFLQRLEYARGVVELVDQVVELLRLRVDGVPRSLCVVPELSLIHILWLAVLRSQRACVSVPEKAR